MCDTHLLHQHVQHRIHIPIIVYHRLHILIVIIPALVQPPRALETPRHDLQPRILDRERVFRRYDGVGLIIDLREREKGRRHDLDTTGRELGDGRCCGREAFLGFNAIVKIDSLLAEGRLVVDPVEDVVGEERLRPYAVGRNASGLVGVDHVLRVLLLCVALERHLDLGRFELWCEFQAPAVHEGDVLIVRHNCPAGRV